MREYRRVRGNINEANLSRLASHIQTVIRTVQSQNISVVETETDHSSALQRVFYMGPFLVNVYHVRCHRQNRIFADLGRDRIKEFAYCLFLQDVPGFSQRIFYIPTGVLLAYIGLRDKRQIVLPLNDTSLPVNGMPPGFTWLSYEGEKGLEAMVSRIREVESAIQNLNRI